MGEPPAQPFPLCVRVFDLIVPGRFSDVQLLVPPGAAVKWLALAACARCFGAAGTPFPSSVADFSSGRELPPGAKVWDVCRVGGALPDPSTPAAAVTPSPPVGLDLPSASLRAVPTSPLPSPAPGAQPRPEEEAAVLLRIAPQRSLWASCAFSASAATRDAAAALVGGEAAAAEAAATANAERNEGGLKSLMIKEFKRGAEIVTGCGHDRSLSTVEFAVDAMLPFVRVSHMLVDGGEGPAGKVDYNMLRRTLVQYYGELLDVFRHFCVSDEPRDGKEPKEGEEDDNVSARPLNRGENGGPLGMAFDVRGGDTKRGARRPPPLPPSPCTNTRAAALYPPAPPTHPPLTLAPAGLSLPLRGAAAVSLTPAPLHRGDHLPLRQ
jgi:hypothetical protein